MADDDGKKKEEEKEFKMPKALEDMMSSMSENMKTFGEGLTAVMTQVNTLSDEVKKKPEAEKKEEPQYQDLERLGRNEFMELMLGKFSDIVDSKMKPVSDQVGNIEKTQSSMTVDQQIKGVIDSGAKDFWEWKDEIGKKVKENPYLNAQEAYDLVRLANPTKAKEMDEKFVKVDVKEETKKEGDLTFGGLTPTSSGSRTEGASEMDGDDAADAAWDKIFGSATDVHV